MQRVIITAKVHDYLRERLTRKGYTVEYAPQMTYEELSATIADVEGLIVTTRLKIDRKILELAPALKWIGRLGSGMELIDTEYAATRGIQCVSSPEGNRNAVGEHVLGMLLGLMNKLYTSHAEIKEGKWIRDANRGTELTGRTVGIIGFGNAGGAFAKLLSSFEVTILAYDKYKYDFAKGNVREASLEQVARYADVVSFHVPLTEETRGLFGSTELGLMKHGALLVNAARGPVVVTEALVEALKTHRIRAALDVTDPEPLPDGHPLWLAPNCLITPHVGGSTPEFIYRAFRFGAAQVRRFIAGEPLENVVTDARY